MGLSLSLIHPCSLASLPSRRLSRRLVPRQAGDRSATFLRPTAVNQRHEASTALQPS